MTHAERTEKNREARQRQKQATEDARKDGWEFTDPSVECFVRPQVTPEKRFLEFRWRKRDGVTESTIFRSFIDDAMLDKWLENADPVWFILSTNHKRGVTHRFSPTKAMLVKILAIQVRLIGAQARPTENKKVARPLLKGITTAREELHKLFPASAMPGNDVCTRLMARFILDEDMLSRNFQALVLSLGESGWRQRFG